MKDLPANRHARKHFKQGFAVHLYAGGEEGFTLRKALKEHRLQKKLLEVDVKRGSSHDMLGNSSTYAGLLGAAVRGLVVGSDRWSQLQNEECSQTLPTWTQTASYMGTPLRHPIVDRGGVEASSGG